YKFYSLHQLSCETDNQIDGVAKLAPIVACYAGKPEMLERVEEATHVTQNNDICVAVALAAARFLEHIILNGPDPKALDAVLEQLSDPNRKNPQELDKAIIGRIHQVKANLSKKPKELIPTAALHGVLTASGYEQAIRDTTSCGGCTCSRCSFIGTCIGAQVGLEGIPSSWKSKTLRYNTLLDLAKKVVTLQQL
uniref:Uncharacterized protein n=1 Tax=Sinocyclocheilus grahami TaxID=75366 RepID=A0A672LRL4_SINGR